MLKSQSIHNRCQKFHEYGSISETKKFIREIRVQRRNDAYRIFCCFDDNSSVVILNGFQKKSNRTPRREIEKAIKLKTDYFNEKRGRL